MALSVGTKAPDFILPTKTADGPKQIRLSENFSKGNTVLLFFPMAFTGTCTTEFCGVSMDMSAFGALMATVYGISGDNPFAQEAWAQKEGITVRLLSDYEHKIAKAYDVMYDSFLPHLAKEDEIDRTINSSIRRFVSCQFTDLISVTWRYVPRCCSSAAVASSMCH